MENINLTEIINRWFELKYRIYDKLEHDGSIYLYYKGQVYAEILINKNSKVIFYEWGLYEEFSEIIPLEVIEFEGYISKWVENTFGLKGFTPPKIRQRPTAVLKIPLV